MANHLVLLGDSIFDNGVYVTPGPDVVRQLQRRLPQDWKATLLAVDGAVASDVPSQMSRLPAGATHLFISAGGNDALRQAGLLDEGASSMAGALSRLGQVGQAFAAGYEQTVRTVLRRELPTTVCTIYNPRFSDALTQKIATTALTVFNDVILRTAFLHGLPVIDLRLVCNEAPDYVNEIEPSCRGGEKIVAAILQVAAQHDFSVGRTQVFAG